jgi:hypothetical protein
MRTVNGIENEEIAGFVYDLLALDRFKEFAKFNFPKAIESWNRRAGEAEGCKKMICECGDHINPSDDYAKLGGKYMCKECLEENL